MSIRNIAVIGVGGVGGYFGGKLCRLLRPSSPLRITFVARGEHLRVIRDCGLRLDTEEGVLECQPSLATDDFGQLGIPDLCLLCVKGFDLVAALRQLEPVIAEHTVVVPLLNGVDIGRRIRSVIQRGLVLPACVYVGTHIESPGRVRQRGGNGRILLGHDPARPGFRADDVVRVLNQAGIAVAWSSDIQGEIWRKFLFICAFGMVSAAYSRTLGEILGDESLRQEVLSIAEEAATLGRATGVSLPQDVATQAVARAGSFPPETRTSFQRDFESLDRPDERDLFAGTMIRMADELGLEVPRTRAIAAILASRKPALPGS